MVPYSKKFSLVQNFAELLVNLLEEIFVVLIFALALAAHAVYVRTIQNFTVLIFASADLFAKNTKVCTMRKFPAIRY